MPPARPFERLVGHMLAPRHVHGASAPINSLSSPAVVSVCRPQGSQSQGIPGRDEVCRKAIFYIYVALWFENVLGLNTC